MQRVIKLCKDNGIKGTVKIGSGEDDGSRVFTFKKDDVEWNRVISIKEIIESKNAAEFVEDILVGFIIESFNLTTEEEPVCQNMTITESNEG